MQDCGKEKVEEGERLITDLRKLSEKYKKVIAMFLIETYHEKGLYSKNDFKGEK